MITQDHPIPEAALAVERTRAERQVTATGLQGFTTEDILWAIGIWSAIISLSPVVVFYFLMVA